MQSDFTMLPFFPYNSTQSMKPWTANFILHNCKLKLARKRKKERYTRPTHENSPPLCAKNRRLIAVFLQQITSLQTN